MTQRNLRVSFHVIFQVTIWMQLPMPSDTNCQLIKSPQTDMMEEIPQLTVTLSRYVKLATKITHHTLAWGATCICVYLEAGFSVRYLSPPFPTLDVEVGSQLIQNITYELVKLVNMSWHSSVPTSKIIRYIWSTILFWHLHRHWGFEVRPFSLDGKCFTP